MKQDERTERCVNIWSGQTFDAVILRYNDNSRAYCFRGDELKKDGNPSKARNAYYGATAHLVKSSCDHVTLFGNVAAIGSYYVEAYADDIRQEIDDLKATLRNAKARLIDLYESEQLNLPKSERVDELDAQQRNENRCAEEHAANGCQECDGHGNKVVGGIPSSAAATCDC